MGSYEITLLVLISFTTSLSKCEHQEFIWRTKGGIIKVEPLCGPTVDDKAEINVYADFPVLVQIYCDNDVTVHPSSKDGVKYSETAALSTGKGSQCVFKKMANSAVYTVKVKVGWEEGKVAVNQAREFFLIDCSYDDKSSNATVPEIINTDKHIYDEVVHHMGPSLINTDVTLEVVDIRGRELFNTYIALGRIIKLKAIVAGPYPVRPVNCVATNGAKFYRLLLGGCGDGLVFNKWDGFVVTGREIYSPYFVAFRLPGSHQTSFKCNFTACPDSTACDGSSCYRSNRKKRSLERVSRFVPTEDTQDDSLISNNTRRHRRSVCRLHQDDHDIDHDIDLSASRHPKCIETKHAVINM